MLVVAHPVQVQLLGLQHLGLARQRLVQLLALQLLGVVPAFRGLGVDAALAGRHPAGGPVADRPAVPVPALFRALEIPAEQARPLVQALALQRQVRVLACVLVLQAARRPAAQPQGLVLLPVAQVQALALLVLPLPVAVVVPQQVVQAPVLPVEQVLVLGLAQVLALVRSVLQAPRPVRPAQRRQLLERPMYHHRSPAHRQVPAALPAIAGAHFQRSPERGSDLSFVSDKKRPASRSWQQLGGSS